jgi:sec-independent protein translocase protein TatA
VLGLSIWKIVIIAGIIMLLFGRGKISETMSDVAKGIKSFKKGMAEDDDEAKTIDAKATERTPTRPEKS